MDATLTSGSSIKLPPSSSTTPASFRLLMPTFLSSSAFEFVITDHLLREYSLAVSFPAYSYACT